MAMRVTRCFVTISPMPGGQGKGTTDLYILVCFMSFSGSRRAAQILPVSSAKQRLDEATRHVLSKISCQYYKSSVVPSTRGAE